MNKILNFFKNRLKSKLMLGVSAILAVLSLSYLSSRVGKDKSLIFWIIAILIGLAIIGALVWLFSLLYKKIKSLKSSEPNIMKKELKAIFKGLKKERKKIGNIPLILFTGAGESSGDELFSKTNFNLLKLNRKQNNGFSLWYCPEFMVLNIGPELLDITCASSKIDKKFKYLLNFLRKKRRHCPINSYIISFPFNYFFQTEPSDLKNNAKEIAKKLEYIQHKLRIRFPSYMLVDKIDVVHGFYDYVNFLGEEAYKQMIGWAAELKVREVLDEKSINNYFEEFSTDLYKRLYKEQSKLYLKSGGTETASFCFYKTIKNIIPTLKDFIGSVFSNATWHFSPLQLRGVFFTAAKRDNRHSYLSYFDTNSQLQYSKIPFDNKAKKFISIKDDTIFFLEDLIRNKILKETRLIVYTSHFLLFMRTLRALSLLIGVGIIFVFIYYSFSQTDIFSREILSEKAKSWTICSDIRYWKGGKFSPVLSLTEKGKYAFNNAKINEEDNLAFVLNFYMQNSMQTNIPLVYILSDCIVGLNEQKNRAVNTIFYTSIINPLLEALLRKYTVKINNMDEITAEIFANVFEYAKLLCDYDVGEKSFFPFYLGTGESSGLNLYLEDAYKYLLNNSDKNTDNKIKMLSDIKIDLQKLFDSDNLPYAIERSFIALKKSDFMTNKEVYDYNISKLIDFCIEDYFLGPKSIKLHQQARAELVKEFLIDAEKCKKDEAKYYQNLTVDEIVKKGKNLKVLLNTINNVNMGISGDSKTVVIGYSLLVREQDKVLNNQILVFDDINNTVKFDVNADFRNSLFFELGLRKNLYKKMLLKNRLTKEQYYLFYPFYEKFSVKNGDFLKRYAEQAETLKSDLSYCLVLKYLAGFLYTYDRQTEDEVMDNIFSLLDNKEIKHNENADMVIRYLVEFSIISKYLDILSNTSFPFTLKELQQHEDLIGMADRLNSSLESLMPSETAVKEIQDSKNIQAVKFQKMINAEKNLPPIIKQWVNNAKAIISFIHANKDFVSRLYLVGQDYSKDFKHDNASDVWAAVEIDQASSEYKPIPALTRTKDNLFLSRVALTDKKPLIINFYRTLDKLAKHQPEEHLYVGTLPLFKFMIDNPNPVPMFKGKYWITWEAAKFDKEVGLWITKIRFVLSDQKELNMHIAFTMPEGAECLKGCLEGGDQKLLLKKL